jgi:hypothetical protein
LCGGHAFEKDRIALFAGNVYGSHARAAEFGECNGVAPAIADIAAPRYEACVLEIVQERDQRYRMDGEALG